MTTLDAKTLAQLAAPFTPAAVKFKPQTVTQDLTKGLASFYIDARLAAERLNEVVGVENWQDEYRLLAEGQHMPALFYPVECRLTVCGVTKVDVGQGANTVLDDKAWKSAYSDALKRAAVKFRIGAFLYTMPSIWAPIKVGRNGKAQGFSPEGIEQLRGQYERWLKSPGNTFGAALDHGDILQDSEPEPQADTAAGGRAASAQRKPEPATQAAAPSGTDFQAPQGNATNTQLAKIDALCSEIVALPNATKTQEEFRAALGPIASKAKAVEVMGKLERLLANQKAAA